MAMVTSNQTTNTRGKTKSTSSIREHAFRVLVLAQLNAKQVLVFVGLDNIPCLEGVLHRHLFSITSTNKPGFWHTGPYPSGKSLAANCRLSGSRGDVDAQIMPPGFSLKHSLCQRLQ